MTARQVTDSRTPRRSRSWDEAGDDVDRASRIDARRILAFTAQSPADTGFDLTVVGGAW